MTNRTIKCRLCEHLCSFQFYKKILGKYDIAYFECTLCQSLQTEEPFWLEEAYCEDAEKFDTGKASRTLENFFNLPSLFNLLKIDMSKPSVDWGGGGGLLTRLLRDLGHNFYCYDLHLKSEFASGFQWEKQIEKVQVVTAFEVVEHFSQPSIEWSKIFELLPDFVICSTEIYRKQKDEWFYLSPHNGQHIFFYSEITLATIAQRFGYTVYNISSYLIFCKAPLPSPQLELLSSWPSQRKVLQQQSFINWWSQPFRFAIQDYEFLSKRQAPIQNQGFVVIDMIFFQLNNSGIARLWESLINHWSQTTFGSKLIILDRAKTAPRISGVRYVDIPGYNHEENDADSRMLERICQENQASVFLSTYYTRPETTPSLLMIYDMIPERMGFDLTHAAWRLKHAAIRHASACICISNNTATDLANYFSLNIENIYIAHCGVDSNFKPANTDEINTARLKYGITKPYFLFVGERAGYKNAGLLFSAMREFSDSDEYQIVCLGGKCEMESEYLPLIEGLDILMFRVENTEIHAIYSGALALVYPSMYEGFGLPVIEAMACGCPVITCRGGSIPEVAGEDVIYTSPDNPSETFKAMIAVQSNEVRDNLIKAGIKRASLFTWSKMAINVQNAIEKINTGNSHHFQR
jgi:glycosyltransferase involved in cell wall biosynthesis